MTTTNTQVTQTVSDDDVVTADDRFARSREALVQAENELVRATVDLIAMHVRSTYPHVETITLVWSDQGDHLDIGEAQHATGETAPTPDWDDFLDRTSLQAYASYLIGSARYVWLPYMEPMLDGRSRNDTDPFRLDIGKTLSRIRFEEATR